MKNKTYRYWACQILGWGGWILLNIFFVYLFARDYYFNGKTGQLFITVLLIQFTWYILSTHLLRAVLKKTSWIEASTNKIIAVFILSVAATGLVSYYGARYTAVLTNNSLANYERDKALVNAKNMEKEAELPADYYSKPDLKNTDSVSYQKVAKIESNTGWHRDENGVWKFENPRKGRFWWDLLFNFILIALWLLLYMAWHFVLRNRKAEVDRLQLEKTVKELEIKTIKSHINPHFIFNSLNSIRALVEENPNRARTAITELSNILRSSLQVEKMETVPLERELNIVRDYLALEQIRFEERLIVNFDIQEETLNKSVPPMMLQTLVENAIKHGISKRVSGGVINVISRLQNNKLELVVENSGSIQRGAEGFGINSTKNRLQFLHNGNSVFTIGNTTDQMVQAKVIMPAG